MLPELEEIGKIIEFITGTIPRTPDSHPTKPLLFAQLGYSHDQRFDTLNELDDLDSAIKYMSTAFNLNLSDESERLYLLFNLGGAHSKRFQHLGELDDIEMAIKYARIAVDSTPDGHPGLPAQFLNLGTFYSIRFERLGELDDLEHAIKHESTALATAPARHPNLSGMLNNLGVSYKSRFARLGGLDDLDKTIKYESFAAALSPDDPSLSGIISNLGVSYTDRFERLGELNDLEKAIEYHSRAVALTPDDHPAMPSHLMNLGISYSSRFERLGEPSDLESAIECKSRALALTPEDHPDLSGRLANLATCFRSRFQRLGELGDIEEAIQSQSLALALVPDNHPDLANILAGLGAYHSDRYERLGELDDIDKAIECENRAVFLSPSDHPEQARRFANLGVSHNLRYEHLGELHDLEKAIEYTSRAVTLTPDGHPDLSGRLDTLGLSYRARFAYFGQLDDLERAVGCQSRALALTQDDNPTFTIRLSNLGTSYIDRFKNLRALDDLEKAIEYQSRAYTLTPSGHPNLPVKLTNLAASHSYRFDLLGEPDDLEMALAYDSRALALNPPGHLLSSKLKANQAIAHFQHYQHTKDRQNLQDSLDSLRSASQSLNGAPRDKFLIAQEWAKVASALSPQDSIEAYQTSINLLPQFIWLGSTTAQRYDDLLMATALATNAASAAIRSSEYGLALEWLEHTRCVVWNQNLMLRSPIDQLRTAHPALAMRLQAVATQLHAASSESQASRTLASGPTNAEQIAQRHRRLAREYNNLLAQAHSLPGFENLLKPTKASGLVGAAKNGPVVVINCDKDGCDALLVQPGQDQIRHFQLPNFTEKKAKHTRYQVDTSVKRRGLKQRVVERRPVSPTEAGQQNELGDVLATLWYDIVKPIITELGYLNDISMGCLPHITWCPTGTMSFLPLHAAGDYGQRHSRVFDYVISSYTPTLTALMESTSSAWDSNSRILAIGQEATPGHSSLPGTRNELSWVKARADNSAKYSELMNDQATTQAVLDAMEKHDWVHLACHAHQNVADATESGFFLHDGVLDLATINRRSFTKKGLAFLSACQTATGDEQLPDEAVHLASGMLMAGYTSVIATMWSVHDEDAPLVADKVYAQLMKEMKLGNGEAGRALHDAVAHLRETVGEQDFERWVSYIHIGS